MRTGSLWIIRLALAVQFLGVLAVPVIVGAAESPGGSKLTFVEQVGHVYWPLDQILTPESPRRAALTIERAIDTVMGGR